jgi:hypothetical protein
LDEPEAETPSTISSEHVALGPLRYASSPQEVLSNAIRRLRLGKKLSQRQLALRLSAPRTYISKLENEKDIADPRNSRENCGQSGRHSSRIVERLRSRPATENRRVGARPIRRRDFAVHGAAEPVPSCATPGRNGLVGPSPDGVAKLAQMSADADDVLYLTTIPQKIPPC